jgi:hypothetical protein
MSLELFGILAKGCSSQELGFFLWKTVENGQWACAIDEKPAA